MRNFKCLMRNYKCLMRFASKLRKVLLHITMLPFVSL